MEASINPDNPWYDYLNNGNSISLFGRIWHGIKVVAADTWGFVGSSIHIVVPNKIIIDIDEGYDNAKASSSSV